MSRFLIALGIVLFLGAGGLMIQKKEHLLATGDRVLLRLVPVDPRSLMQGDFMRLDYELRGQMPPAETLPRRGVAIVGLDARGVASFVRLDDGRPLASGEGRLRFTNRGRVAFCSDSFLFEEGSGGLFSRARFAALRVDGRGESVLESLLDENLAVIRPASAEQ